MTLPHAAIAAKYGKLLLAYEAGQSLASDNALTNQVRPPGGRAREWGNPLHEGAWISLSCRSADGAPGPGDQNGQVTKVRGTAKARPSCPSQRRITQPHHLPPLVAHGALQTPALQANRDGGMYRLYTRYLNGLKGANLSLVCHYSSVTAYSRYGSWGLMEWMDQDPRTAPKLQVGPRAWRRAPPASLAWGRGVCWGSVGMLPRHLCKQG